jgi:hypothetical protein
MNKRSITRAVIILGLCLLSAFAGAQALPEAPKKAPAGAGAYNYLYRAAWVCGTGASHSSIATKPTVQCGGLFSSFIPFVDLEAGVMVPQANRSSVSAYLSTNASVPLVNSRGTAYLHGLPLLVGGYTRMFETGHAADYGVAFAHTVDESHSLQFEVRDYVAFSNPTQHNVIFRVMWMTGIPD